MTLRTSWGLIAGLHRDKQPFALLFAAMDNLEFPTDLMCMFLDCERKPENPARTHADMQTLQIKVPGIKPTMFSGALSIVPPCHPGLYLKKGKILDAE